MAAAGVILTGTAATGIAFLDDGLITLLDDRLSVFGKRPATRSEADTGGTDIRVAAPGIVLTGTAATRITLLDGRPNVTSHGKFARAAAVTTPAHVSVAAASVVVAATARALGVTLWVDGIVIGRNRVVDGVLAQEFEDGGFVEVGDVLTIVGQNGSVVGDWGC